MKNKLILTGVFLSLAVISLFLLAGSPISVSAEMKENVPMGMSMYLVESPHTSAECLKALDDVQAMGQGVLAQYDWGCMDSDHAGYLIIGAASKTDALNYVPVTLRGKARVIKLNKFTADEIKALHAK